MRLGHFEQLDPQAHQRQIQNQQHHVADVERCNQRPHQSGRAGEELRAGLNAVALECAHEHGCGVRCRDAEREQRNQGRSNGSIVGRLGASHAFNRAFAEFFGVLRELFFSSVGEKSRNLAAACGDRAEGNANGCAAQPCRPRAFPLGGSHMHLAHRVLKLDFFALVQREIQRFANRKQADRDQYNLNAIEHFRDTAGVARLSGDLIEAHQAHGQANEERHHATQDAAAQHRTHRAKRQHHEQEILRWPEFDGMLCDEGRSDGDDNSRNRAGHERANRRGGQSRTGAPRFGHFVAFHRRDQ